MEPNTSPQSSPKLKISLDYRLIVVLLLIVIAGMLAMWRPWQNPQAKDRTVAVTGEATLKAVPDEFVFNPSYDFNNADKQLALSALTKKSNEIVAKLKTLGVADSQIKTNSSGNDYPVFRPSGDNSGFTYTLQLTVTVGTKDLAQKVQDYLVTTSPAGEVSPQANFSDAKRKDLERQARDAATKDARAKADQSAKNLGFKIGLVKTVTDGTGFGGIVYPMTAVGSAKATDLAQPSLTIQPGENDLSYTVTVTYYLK
jgi:uncharacterized protein YggE